MSVVVVVNGDSNGCGCNSSGGCGYGGSNGCGSDGSGICGYDFVCIYGFFSLFLTFTKVQFILSNVAI